MFFCRNYKSCFFNLFLDCRSEKKQNLSSKLQLMERLTVNVENLILRDFSLILRV